MAINQFVARNGLISLDDTVISGSLFVSQSVTASVFTGSFTGSLFGTASWADSASNAINAVTASYITGSIFSGSNSALSSSYAVTASYAETFLTPTYIATGSITASVNIDGNSFQIVSGSSTVLHISSSGYVGIGTTIESEKLQVAGNIFILTGSNSSYEPYGMLKFANPAYPNNYAAIQSSGYAKGIDAANLVFITNPGQGSTAKAVLSGGGNLMIGGNLSFSSSAYHRLDVDASGLNASGSALRLNYDGSKLTNISGAGAHIFLENDNTNGQNVIVSFIKNKFVGKIRNSYDGNMNYVVSGSGGHYFWTGGDVDSGSVELSVLDSNVNVSASLNITGSTNQLGNINITGSIQMSGSSYISGVDYIDFDITASAPAQSEGRLFWNADSKTLQLDLEQNFHTDINQQMLVRVVNKTGADITSGSVVYISGSQGQRPGIKLASYESDDTSAATVGFTVKTINNNNNGYIITRGILDGLDTSGYSVGDRLFLSSSGTFTNVAPDAPLHEVRLGKVIVSDAGTGSIYVDIMNGYEIDELHDVKATNPNYGDLFMYSSSLWTATKQLSGSYELTGSLNVSGSVKFTNLTTESKQWVITYDSASGQLYYTASSAFGGTTGPSNITIKDEGINLTTAVSSIDFVGSGVSATNVGSAVTVTINTSNIDTTGFVSTSSFNAFTSSVVTNSQTASFVTNSQTSSFITNSQTSSFITNSQTSSFVTTSSFNSWTGSNQSQFAGTASYALNAANAGTAGISQGKVVAITTGLSNLF